MINITLVLKMNYLPDKITENYRLIYMMADNYAKLDDSLGRTNQDGYYDEFDIFYVIPKTTNPTEV